MAEVLTALVEGADSAFSPYLLQPATWAKIGRFLTFLAAVVSKPASVAEFVVNLLQLHLAGSWYSQSSIVLSAEGALFRRFIFL